MRHALVIAVVVAQGALLGARASSVAPAPVPHRSPSKAGAGPGAVTYVTQNIAYLNRGTEAGLVPGTVVKLVRRGEPVGTCKVSVASPQHASCVGEARVGDLFRVKVAAPREVAVPAPERLWSPAELARQRTALVGSELPLVEFDARSAKAGALGAHLLDASASAESWSVGYEPDASFTLERVDLRVPGAAVGAGVRLFLDAAVLSWSTRPSTYRFPVRSPWQLWVREAALSSREEDRTFTVSAGRIWAGRAPGLTAIDGLQAGMRPSDQSEVGLFAGTLPDPISLAPTTDAFVAGLYQGWQGGLGGLRLLREEARASVRNVPGAGMRFEAEAMAELSPAPALTIGGDVRIGAGALGPLLDLARLSVDTPATSRVRLSLQGRYLSGFTPDLLLAGFSPGRTLDVQGTWTYQATSAVALALNVGLFDELGAARLRALGGPELVAPRLFGDWGGGSLGYQAASGDDHGQQWFAQAQIHPRERLDLFTRLSLGRDGAGALDVPQTELRLFVGAELALTQALSLRLTAFGAEGLGSQGWGSDGAIRPQSSSALWGQAALGGSL